MIAVSIVSSGQTGRVIARGLLGATNILGARNLLRIALGLALALLVASQAAAQYGGGGGTGGMGGGTTGTGYSSGSAGKAAGIGAGAAAGAGVLFLALHHRGYVTGCVQPAEDGLRLVDEKKNQSYTLVPGDVFLKAGQRVELKGQKLKNDSGAQTFEAKKLVKDLGSCGATSSANSKP